MRKGKIRIKALVNPPILNFGIYAEVWLEELLIAHPSTYRELDKVGRSWH